MKKIRIGKDIHFKWSIKTNGVDVSLENRDLKLELRHSSTSFRMDIPIEIDPQNKTQLLFTFKGKDHPNTGVYMLTLWENKGKDNQTVVDKMQAFELVKYTDMEA